MRQLVELQTASRSMGRRGQSVEVAAIVIDDRRGTGGTDIPSVSGFRGPVLLDVKLEAKKGYDAANGTVVLVDPEGRTRWIKPGSNYKRPRADLVQHAVEAVLARDREPDALQAAADRMEVGDAGDRRRALELFAELEAVELRAEIEARLADEDARVRAQAVETLRILRDPGCLPALAAVAENAENEAELREAAARALVGFGDDYGAYPGENFRPDYVHAESRDLAAARGVLLPAADALLAAREVELNHLGARLLWRLRHADAKARLLELVSDRDMEVRAAALAGLAEWRDEPEVRAAAEAHLRDRDSHVRRLARYVFEGPKGKVRE